MFSFLSFFSVFTSSRRPGEKYTRDNDPCRYMRELEFRNTIDQYDMALVLFFDKDNDECKRMINGYKYAAERSHGKADYIVISSKHASDLADELGVESYPTLFAFRYGTLIEKLPNTTQGRECYFYVGNATASKYKYVESVDEVPGIIDKRNTTVVVAIPDISAKMDKTLTVVGTKFMKKTQLYIAQTEEIAEAFHVPYPGITIIRTQDDKNVTYKGDINKATTKSLIDFLTKNIDPKYELMNSTYHATDKPGEMYFAAIFDFLNKTQEEEAKEILDKLAIKAQEEKDFKFPIRYGDVNQLMQNLTRMNLQNYTTPIYGFFSVDQFNYHKWIFKGNPTPNAIVLFATDQVRGKNKELIVDTPVVNPRGRYPLMQYTGSELKKQLDTSDKDIVVNFVGYPCKHCAEIDNLFSETALWARANSVHHVLFATVNASCNDIPVTVWRNETFPYGWMFPAGNRTGAFPIGKRRDLYWMVQLLADNCTTKLRAKMPPKPAPSSKPLTERENKIYAKTGEL